VRDKPTSASLRSGRDGLIFQLRSGDEEVAWQRSRVLLPAMSASWLSSEMIEDARTLLEGLGCAPSSMQ
jgi:hypothetical protein